MRCRQVRQRLNELELRGSRFTDDRELLEHLAGCIECTREAKAIGELRSAMTGERMRVDEEFSDLQLLRHQVETRAKRRPRTNLEIPTMSELKKRVSLRPRLSLGIAVAVLALAFVTLVPFKYDKTVGFEVAVAGVDKKLAFDEYKIQEMLGRLGIDAAEVNVVGCEQTCNLKISELETAEDCQVVLATFDKISGNELTLQLVECKEAAFGSLIEHASNSANRVKFDFQSEGFDEAHNVFIERLGDSENCDLYFVDEFGDVITEVLHGPDGEKTVISHVVMLDGGHGDAHRGDNVMFTPEECSVSDLENLVAQCIELGCGDGERGSVPIIELNRPASDDPQEVTRFEEYLEQLKDQGYVVETVTQEDGSTTYLLKRSPDNEGEAVQFGDEDALAKETGELPEEFSLSQNYPNPFNPTTRIDYSLPSSQTVKLDIYNIQGQLVRTLVDGTMPAGNHTVEWDATTESGSQIASGVYLYRITAGGNTESRKMNFVK